MEWYGWVLILVILGLGWLLFIKTTGKHRFWKTVAQYPDTAYFFFLESPEWRVEDGINDVLQPSREDDDWHGPFYLQVPILDGQTVVLYGRSSGYEATQDLFLAMIGVSKPY